MKELIPAEVIEKNIYLIRGYKVMLDTDLATIYGVPTKRLNEQVKRNADRFPADFAFQLTAEEWVTLKSQIATPSLTKTQGHRTDANRSQIATGSPSLWRLTAHVLRLTIVSLLVL